MNQNVRIARQLLKIAKSLVADTKSGFKMKVMQIKSAVDSLCNSVEAAGANKNAVECHPSVDYELDTDEMLKFKFNLNPKGKYAIQGLGVEEIPQISAEFWLMKEENGKNDTSFCIISFGSKVEKLESNKPMQLFSQTMKKMDECYKTLNESATGRILPLNRQGSVNKVAADDAISRLLQDTARKFENLDQKFEGLDDDEM